MNFLEIAENREFGVRDRFAADCYVRQVSLRFVALPLLFSSPMGYVAGLRVWAMLNAMTTNEWSASLVLVA